MKLWKITITNYEGKSDCSYATCEDKEAVYAFAEQQADSHGCESYSVQYVYFEELDKYFDITAVTVLN